MIDTDYGFLFELWPRKYLRNTGLGPLEPATFNPITTISQVSYVAKKNPTHKFRAEGEKYVFL